MIGGGFDRSAQKIITRHTTYTQPPPRCHPGRGIFCDNESMEDVRIQGWYTSPPSLTGLHFLFERTCLDMTPVERLIEAGIRPDCAVETVEWYRTQGDDHILERYIQEAELRHGIQVLQPKPI